MEATEKLTFFSCVNEIQYKKGKSPSYLDDDLPFSSSLFYSFSLRSFSIRLRLTTNIAVAP